MYQDPLFSCEVVARRAGGFMEREDCRRRPLIGPMNLRASPSVEAMRSMAAVSFGAFVPVGKIGSGALHVNCLATPMRCSRWEALLSFC